MAGNPAAFQPNAFQNNAFQTGDPVPPTDDGDGRTKYGGWAELEEYKARRRQNERALEARETEARELKLRLEKAEAELQRKAKAKRESKAKKALQERIDRFISELEQTEAQISAILLEIKTMELQAAQLLALDRRRRLLLLMTL